MFFKILSTFLIAQILGFALWQGVQARPLKKVANEPIHATSESQALNHVHFSSKSESNQLSKISDVQKKEIINVLKRLPQQHTTALKNIVLDYNPKAHRGLGNAHLIILRATNISIEEFFAVMIHEIGHSVDLGVIQSKDKAFSSHFKDGNKLIYEGDESLNFYKISWVNESQRKKTATNADFVSGYAMSDPFEDFAESYAYYILHNKEFQAKAATNEALLEKYYFMKNMVFDGKVFNTGKTLQKGFNNRPWDITKLNYDLGKLTK